MSSLQHSFRNRIQSNSTQNYSVYRLVEGKSLQESPKSGSFFWLRRTQCNFWNNSKEKFARSDGSQKKNHLIKHLDRHLNNKREQNINCPYFTKFKSLQNLNLSSALYLLVTSIKQCLNMHNLYGSSYFNINNYYLNSENQIIVSTNDQALRYNLKSAASSQQSVVVRDIIESIHKICSPRCFDDFYSYYKRTSLKTKCDFRFTLMLIRSYCQCSKITLPNYVSKQQHAQFKYKKPLFYPKSQQKTFALKGNYNPRKNSFSRVSKRESISKKLFSPPNQIDLSNQRESHQQFQFEQDYKKFPKPNIQINTQYNIIYNPKLQDVATSQRKPYSIKESTISTNFKSSHLPGDYSQIGMINIMSRISTCPFKSDKLILTKSNACKEHFSFLPTDLDQVQSLGQSSDYQQSQPTTRRFETPRDSHQQNTRKENEERILTINNWTKRVNSLLAQETDLKESYMDDTNKYKSNVKTFYDPQGLSRMVRTIAQSVLPVPSEFHARNP